VYGRGREPAAVTVVKTLTLMTAYGLAAGAGMIATLMVALLAKS
jgi:hypothetical protein